MDLNKYVKIEHGHKIPPEEEGAVSLSRFCRDNNIDRDSALSWLIREEYVFNIRNPLNKGLLSGVSTRKLPDNEEVYLVYGPTMQKRMLAAVEQGEIKKILTKEELREQLEESCGVIVDEYVSPDLPFMSFEHIGISPDEIPMLILDTETTGLNADDEIIELALLDFCGNEVYHSFFRPTKEISPVAMQKTGITNKMLKDAPLFADEWKNIKEALRGMSVIGHNIPFDLRMINRTLSRYGIHEKFFAPHLDSMDIAKSFFEAKNYKLETLCHELGIVDEQKHRATYDCLMVLKMLRALEQKERDEVSYELE